MNRRFRFIKIMLCIFTCAVLGKNAQAMLKPKRFSMPSNTHSQRIKLQVPKIGASKIVKMGVPTSQSWLQSLKRPFSGTLFQQPKPVPVQVAKKDLPKLVTFVQKSGFATNPSNKGPISDSPWYKKAFARFKFNLSLCRQGTNLKFVTGKNVGNYLQKNRVSGLSDKDYGLLLFTGVNTSGSLLHEAVRSDRESVVKMLLEYGESVNTKDDCGRTPLFYAQSKGVVKALFEYGAEVDVRDNHGDTPLWWALQCGSLEHVKALLECGANANDRDDDDATPLHSLLRTSGGLCERSDDEKILIIKALLEHGANINAQDKYGCTPLHAGICAFNRSRFVKYLLEHGAGVNVRDKKGRTPLDRAFEIADDREVDFPQDTIFIQEDKKVIDILLQYGGVQYGARSGARSNQRAAHSRHARDTSDALVELGFERGDSPTHAQVKRAYRKLALEHHPDARGDANKFKKIQAAYDSLKDDYQEPI
ncbi:MAG: ankyrin repeat domain-containing protein [Epsilonproteobacteria bacterium]|nr:ankyrin repeat domain-containing protein [Campylobacterota bacterium]